MNMRFRVHASLRVGAYRSIKEVLLNLLGSVDRHASRSVYLYPTPLYTILARTFHTWKVLDTSRKLRPKPINSTGEIYNSCLLPQEGQASIHLKTPDCSMALEVRQLLLTAVGGPTSPPCFFGVFFVFFSSCRLYKQLEDNNVDKIARTSRAMCMTRSEQV